MANCRIILFSSAIPAHRERIPSTQLYWISDYHKFRRQAKKKNKMIIDSKLPSVAVLTEAETCIDN